MKDYKGFFDEAVSARRLAELKAKGKGGAAAAKMASDGLKGEGGKKTGGGSALARRDKKALPGSKGGAMAQQDKKARFGKKDKGTQRINTDMNVPNDKKDKQNKGLPGSKGRTLHEPTGGDLKHKGFTRRQVDKAGNWVKDQAKKTPGRVFNYVKGSLANSKGTADSAGGSSRGEPGTKYQ